MNPPTTLTNHNPPATIGCGLNPNPIRREESDISVGLTAVWQTKTVRTNAQAAPTRSHGIPERNPSAIVGLTRGLAGVALDTRSEYRPPDRSRAGLPALPTD